MRDEIEEGTNAIDIDSLPHLPEVTAPAAPQPQQQQFQRPPPPAGPQSQFQQNAGQFQGQQVVHRIALISDRAARIARSAYISLSQTICCSVFSRPLSSRGGLWGSGPVPAPAGPADLLQTSSETSAFPSSRSSNFYRDCFHVYLIIRNGNSSGQTVLTG